MKTSPPPPPMKPTHCHHYHLTRFLSLSAEAYFCDQCQLVVPLAKPETPIVCCGCGHCGTKETTTFNSICLCTCHKSEAPKCSTWCNPKCLVSPCPCSCHSKEKPKCEHKRNAEECLSCAIRKSGNEMIKALDKHYALMASFLK